MKAAFAGDKFSLTKKEKTSDIARRNKAVLAINGDACGFNNDSLVIRNGKIYRKNTLSGSVYLDDKGNLKLNEPPNKSLEGILKVGIIHSFFYGSTLMMNGNLALKVKDKIKHPRTTIGQKTPYEYIIIVVDGRSSISHGLTLYELAKEFERLGCHTAYNLDGGGSTTLYFNGNIINTPSDYSGERAISDILYFTE